MDLGLSSQPTHFVVVAVIVKPRPSANLLPPSHLCLQVSPLHLHYCVIPQALGSARLLTPPLERKAQPFSSHVVIVKNILS